jgi:hypothetical protein
MGVSTRDRCTATCVVVVDNDDATAERGDAGDATNRDDAANRGLVAPRNTPALCDLYAGGVGASICSAHSPPLTPFSGSARNCSVSSDAG